MKVSIQITDQRIKDLLCSAFEGGSNDWYLIVAENYPAGKTFESLNIHRDFFPHLELPLMEGGSLTIGDIEDDKVEPVILDRNAIEKGLRIMADKYPLHFGDFLNENDDATTGDVFLQCCCFGKLVYR